LVGMWKAAKGMVLRADCTSEFNEEGVEGAEIATEEKRIARPGSEASEAKATTRVSATRNSTTSEDIKSSL
jgi:hypothetical protein